MRDPLSARLMVLLLLVLLAYAVRVYHLDTAPLAWDEGWSVALSQLPAADVLYLTAADVHPPGYYAVLRLWMTLGKDPFVIRYLSLVFGGLAVPLAYQAGRAWVGRAPGSAVGYLAAGYVAVAPLLIYYAQVGRMYALCVAATLLATWGLLRCLDPERPASAPALAGWVVGALAALFSFYYSALALAGLAGYAVLVSGPLWRTAAGRRGLARVGAASVLIAGLYLPWIVYALGPAATRVGNRTEGVIDLAGAAAGMATGLYGVLFAYGPGWPAVWLVLAVVVLGALLSLVWRRRAGGLRPTLLILPVLVLGLTLFGVALGTQAHMFAARYTIAATPFVALGVAFGLAVLGARSARLAAVGILLVGAITVWPTVDGRVYAKDLERSGAFDPAADARALRALGSRAEDVAVFNVLSLAGAYDVYRRPSDPAWSYAQRWDPVTEPIERVTERLNTIAARHGRLWTVLYQGTVGPNAEVKAWLDRHLFPAGATWREETLVTLHLSLVEPRAEVDLGVMWANGAALTEAAYTTETQPGGGITVDLKWQARQPIERDYTVFVHLYDAAGRLVAQHDSQPAGGSRPTADWPPGRGVPDPHGLVAPLDAQGTMTLRVGLYDSQSGQRAPLASGGESAEIGQVRVGAR